MSSAKQTAGARLQGVVAQRQQGAAGRPGRRARARRTSRVVARVAVDDLRNPKELNAVGRRPVVPAVDARRAEQACCAPAAVASSSAERATAAAAARP